MSPCPASRRPQTSSPRRWARRCFTDTLPREEGPKGGQLLTQPKPLSSVEAGERNRFVYAHTPWGSTPELISYPDEQPYTQHTDLRRWRP